MKFDELAQFVIDRGLARKLTKEDALDVIKITEQAGLVHFVDNSEGEIKHNCNCCGCACWNVGNIKRRKIPPDSLMETYFIRRTEHDNCSGCGECAKICPVQAVEMEDDIPVVDEKWCIGCGVCAVACPTDAITIGFREDKSISPPAVGFEELHNMILEERRIKTVR